MGDLGQYAQAFYKTIFEGKLFQMNNRISERNPSGSYFGEHFAPILFLFLPIFALYPRPETLLVLKAVVGGLAILPLYALARDLTGSDKVATFISLAYVLNPHLFIARTFDFQEQCILPLLIFIAHYAYIRRRWKTFTLSSILTLMVNEFLSLIYAGYILALIVHEIRDLKKSKKRGTWLLLLAVLLIVSGFWLLLAHVVRSQFCSEGAAVTYASGLPIQVEDRTVWGIAMTFLKNPKLLIDAVSYDAQLKVFGIVSFFAMYLMTPLVTLESVLPSLPYIVFALITSSRSVYLFTAHYSFYLAPFAFIAFIKFVSLLRQSSNDMASRVYRAFLIVNLISLVFMLLWLTSISQVPIIDSHVALLHEVIRLIKPGTVVITQNNIAPHLSTITNVFTSNGLPPLSEILKVAGNITADYILVDLRSSAWGVRWGQLILPYALDALRGGGYGVLAYDYYEGIILLARNYSDLPKIFRPPSTITYTGDTLYVEHGIKLYSNEFNAVVIRRRPGDGIGTLFFGPYDLYPPGRYVANITLQIRTEKQIPVNETILRIDVDSSRGKGKPLVTKYISLRDVCLNATSCIGSDMRVSIVIGFELKSFTPDVEFRGMVLNENLTITLIRIDVYRIEKQ